MTPKHKIYCKQKKKKRKRKERKRKRKKNSDFGYIFKFEICVIKEVVRITEYSNT